MSNVVVLIVLFVFSLMITGCDTAKYQNMTQEQRGLLFQEKERVKRLEIQLDSLQECYDRTVAVVRRVEEERQALSKENDELT